MSRFPFVSLFFSFLEYFPSLTPVLKCPAERSSRDFISHTTWEAILRLTGRRRRSVAEKGKERDGKYKKLSLCFEMREEKKGNEWRDGFEDGCGVNAESDTMDRVCVCEICSRKSSLPLLPLVQWRISLFPMCLDCLGWTCISHFIRSLFHFSIVSCQFHCPRRSVIQLFFFNLFSFLCLHCYYSCSKESSEPASPGGAAALCCVRE